MKRLLSVLVLAALVVGPVSAFAQQEPQLKVFTSPDGKLTLSYPADWVAGDAGGDVPLPNAVLASSEDALNRSNNGADLVSGDIVIDVLVFPTEYLPLTDVQLPGQPQVTDYAKAFADLFVGPGTPSVGEGTPTPEGPQVGEPQEITLTENIPAGYVEVSDSTAQGAFIVHELSDSLLAITFVATFPGEFNQDVAKIAQDVAASVDYGGTVEDVVAPLMAGEETTGATPEATTAAPSEATPTPSSATGAALNGEQLVNERCTTCHTLTRVTRAMAAGTSRTRWEQIVDQMISYGAQLNSDERTAVIDYLSGQSGATPTPTPAPAATPTAASASTGATLNGAQLVSERCTVCHSIDRINNKIASGADRAAWEQTVDRMISHGAKLNADERQAVIDYLVAQSSK
jgi:cytochrome c5